jgi:hypothetical protein
MMKGMSVGWIEGIDFDKPKLCVWIGMDGWMEGAEEAKRIFVDGVWVEMEMESVHSFSVYVCIHRAGVIK